MRTWPGRIVGIAYVVLLGLAIASAVSSAGEQFLSFALDTYGEYSLVLLPGWQRPPGLTFPDRVESIDGVAVTAPRASTRANVVADVLSRSSGPRQVSLTFSGQSGTRTVSTPVGRFGVREIWVLFGLYALVGAFIAGSALVVSRIASSTSTRIAYCVWALSVTGFLTTFFDFHSRGWLHVVFTLSTIGMALGPLLLAVSFPFVGSRRVWTATVAVTSALGGIAAVWAIGAAIRGSDALILRQLITFALPPSMLLFAVVVVVRIFRTPIQRRSEVVIAAVGMGLAPLLGCVAQVFTLVTHIDVLHLFLPALVAIFPLSVGVAMVRRNILRSATILRPWQVFLPVSVVALLVATFAWVYVTESVSPASKISHFGITIAIAVFFGAAAVTWIIAKKVLHLQQRSYLPIIERLRNDVFSVRTVPAARQVLENAAQQQLPGRSVRVIDLGNLPLPGWPERHLEQLKLGKRVWAGTTASREIVLPISSLGQLRAALVVTTAPDSPLLTEAEIVTLEAIASIGALALHNAETLQKAEELRVIERHESTFSLATIGAEAAHEILFSLGFLRYLLGEAQSGHPLSAKDFTSAEKEVSRLERLLTQLRGLCPSSSPPTAVPVRQTVEHVRRVLSPLLADKEFDIDIPYHLCVNTVQDRFIQVMANLIRNAATQTPPGGALGVRFANSTLSLEVWDTGPGIADHIKDTLFSPWVPSGSGGWGLGLAVVNRLCKSFGWQLGFDSTPVGTTFRVTFDSVVVSEEAA